MHWLLFITPLYAADRHREKITYFRYVGVSYGRIVYRCISLTYGHGCPPCFALDVRCGPAGEEDVVAPVWAQVQRDVLVDVRRS